MQSNRKLLASALVLGAVLATHARAQSALPLSVEVRGGASFPTGDFADGAKTGWNVGASVLYSVQPNVGFYLGFEHDDFSVDDTENDGVDVGITDDGARGGVRVSLPLSGGTTRVWLEAGALFNRTSVSGSDGDVSASVDSDWKIGFETGVGIAVDVSPRISLTPGVRYRQHGVKFSDISEDATGDVNYVAVDLGVNIHL
jgi:opacity protein-like surface antigen